MKVKIFALSLLSLLFYFHIAHAMRLEKQNKILVVEFNSAKKTWFVHWFPLQERTKPGGDPLNNLFALSGAIHKLDLVTGGNACEYEYAHNRKGFNEGKEFAWLGHNHSACEVGCLFEPPCHDVIMMDKNGQEVLFTKHDIQGLLVKISSLLVRKVEFVGKRCSSKQEYEDLSEPSPENSIETLKVWAKDNLPIVVNISRSEQIWHFPYDHVEIFESDKSFLGCSATASPNNEIKFYKIEMSSTGFRDKGRCYECFIERNYKGEVVKSDWFTAAPAFFWRIHPVDDILNKVHWQKRTTDNPEIDPLMVRLIYLKSRDMLPWNIENHVFHTKPIKNTIFTMMLLRKFYKKTRSAKICFVFDIQTFS